MSGAGRWGSPVLPSRGPAGRAALARGLSLFRGLFGAERAGSGRELRAEVGGMLREGSALHRAQQGFIPVSSLVEQISVRVLVLNVV